MSYTLASVVVPAYRQAAFIGSVLRSYKEGLEKLPIPHELVVVVNGPDDGTLAASRSAAKELGGVRVVESEPGWGSAVQTGLDMAAGDLLCYTNSARTTQEALTLLLFYAVSYPGVVVKATRKTRDNLRRRFGSLLYNLECRWLFDLSCFDVNGTPKAFPRTFERLLHLESRDDLIDAEFLAVCRLANYPIIEVPTIFAGRHGGTSTTNIRSAIRMYSGALRLARALSTDR